MIVDRVVLILGTCLFVIAILLYSGWLDCNAVWLPSMLAVMIFVMVVLMIWQSVRDQNRKE